MGESRDLGDMLRDWEYDEEDNARFLTGNDGRDIMQIRQPLGIEQYDLDGRPDGLRPEGEACYLDLYIRREEAAESEGNGLVLDDRDFSRLQTEGILFYQRYLALFQVGQYDRVVRDTEHNLSICTLLDRRYPANRRFEILQYRPYIRRINAIARAMVRLAENEPKKALEELENGKAEIGELPPVPTPVFEFEKIRSLQHLEQVIGQIQEDIESDSESSETEEPAEGIKGFKERLADELSRAVENEDYERAARLRDRLAGLD